MRGRLLALTIAAALFLVGSMAHAAPPPPIPVVPDANRSQTYNITSPTTSVQVPFAIYGDCTDIVVTYNNVPLVLNTDFTCASAAGGSVLTSLPLPITDMVVTFATSPTVNLPSVPPSSGTITISGAWHARRTLQPSAPGINRREFNAAISALTIGVRELYDQFSQQTNGAAFGSLLYVGANGVLQPIAPPTSSGECFISLAASPPYGWGGCSGSGGGGGNVNGPASGGSTSGDLAIWDGTTGTLLKDLHIPYNAIPAAYVTFTQQGTGAVPTNLGKRGQQEQIYVEDYGVDCTGATDSTADLTAAVDAALSGLIQLRVCQAPGGIKVHPTAPIAITGAFSMQGAGGFASMFNNTSLTTGLFTITTNTATYWFDVGYEQTGGTPTAGAFITDNNAPNENAYSQFRGIVCNGVAYCLDLERASHWTIADGIEQSCFQDCLVIQNTNNQDSGDSTVINTQFLEFQGGVCATTGTGVLQEGSGGTKWIGDKWSCGNVGYNLSLNGTVNSGTENFVGNSSENQNSAAFVFQTNAAAASQWHAVTFSGDEIETNDGGNGILITGSGGAASNWIGQIAITGLTGTVASLGGGSGGAMINAQVGEDIAVSGSTVNNNGSGTGHFFFVGASTFSGCSAVAANNITRGFGASAYSNSCVAGSP
jgi:hypothetical protein